MIEGYYRLGKKEKARKLYHEVTEKHNDQLQYFESLSIDLQYQLGEEILTEV